MTRAGLRVEFGSFNSMIREVARGMTAPDVGSGALLGQRTHGRKWLGLKSMIMVKRSGVPFLLPGRSQPSRTLSDRGELSPACRQELWIFPIAIASHAQRQR